MSNDAALLARQEDDLKTQIAQGDTSKLKEMVVNRSLLPGALAAEFQVAADAVASQEYQQKQEVFIAQQDAAADQKQAQADKDAQQKQQEAWLANMTPEYREAYSGLMTAIGNADKEYAQDRKLLQDHLQKLQAEEKTLDDNALKLSDGSRAYKNANGQLVDKDGKELQGKDAEEAKILLQNHVGPLTSFDAEQKNAKGQNDTKNLQKKIDTYQAADHQSGRDATNPAHPDVPKTRLAEKTTGGHAADIHQQTAALAGNDRATIKSKNAVSLADMGLDDSPAPAPTHSSYASTVDPNAGIHANSVTNTFNAATQGVSSQAAPAPAAQKPIVALPSPA